MVSEPSDRDITFRRFSLFKRRTKPFVVGRVLFLPIILSKINSNTGRYAHIVHLGRREKGGSVTSGIEIELFQFLRLNSSYKKGKSQAVRFRK
jgi:hypothetical protein